jgi:hypothetical protein
LKDLIFILDRFGISDNAYNELSIFEKDLPRKTLINQCRDVISKSYKFQRTAGNIPGAYVSFKEELIKYIKSNVSADSQLLKVKISGDGSKVSRISNFIVLSFSIVQNETHLTSLDQNVFCIINCKENYEQLNAACKPVFDEINELIAEKRLFVIWGRYEVSSNHIRFRKLFDGVEYTKVIELTCPNHLIFITLVQWQEQTKL